MEIKIAENLSYLRAKNRYTLEEVADIIGVSRQSVAKWESGGTYPDIENCLKLSMLYKISLDTLVRNSVMFMKKENNESPRYSVDIVKLNDECEIPLPPNACSLFGIEKGDKLLVLADKEQGIALVKCNGMYDVLDGE